MSVSEISKPCCFCKRPIDNDGFGKSNDSEKFFHPLCFQVDMLYNKIEDSKILTTEEMEYLKLIMEKFW